MITIYRCLSELKELPCAAGRELKERQLGKEIPSDGLRKPHIACTLIEERIGEDLLLRSEMIYAVSLMIDQFQIKNYREYHTVPVSITHVFWYF